MLSPRQVVQIRSWPDPVLQEHLEEVGFFYDRQRQGWICFCEADEVESWGDWLKRRHLLYVVTEAVGRGEVERLPKLSAELLLPKGGNASHCALCGARGVLCRQWIEGDDTDSTEYAGAKKFFMCGKCVRERMSPHPRLYAPVESRLY